MAVATPLALGAFIAPLIATLSFIGVSLVGRYAGSRYLQDILITIWLAGTILAVLFIIVFAIINIVVVGF